MLELFAGADARVTCFFLGWVGEKFPHLVREAAAAGHEIASHGWSHRMIHVMGERDFHEEAVRSRAVLEDISGEPVTGYRSAGFSITANMPWFFDRLVDAGYLYDSSVFPSPREYGGIRTDRLGPYRFTTRSGGELVEFPISVKRVCGRSICFFGGGYLRLFPMRLIERMSDSVLDEGRPVVFYIHPREIDPSHPRLPMGLSKRFKCYVNLGSTEPKMRRILARHQITTFRQYIADHPELRGPESQPTAVAAAL
jgi:polysaccharide deacetylase family protein (PEP-CTERM system associated)